MGTTGSRRRSGAEGVATAGFELASGGVARAPMGLGMLVVRGAAPGDTRVFLDGQEIPQLYHFGGVASVIFTGLPNVNYHWRARSLDAQGRGSPWVPFGGNADGQIDFRIDSNAVGAGGSNTVQGTSSDHKDKCGLAGLEALALIGLAAFARRRRKA